MGGDELTVVGGSFVPAVKAKGSGDGVSEPVSIVHVWCAESDPGGAVGRPRKYESPNFILFIAGVGVGNTGGTHRASS